MQVVARSLPDLDSPFALSEKPSTIEIYEKPSTIESHARPPSARLKAKRDRGESIDYIDLANGDVTHKTLCLSEPRKKRNRSIPVSKTKPPNAQWATIMNQDSENIALPMDTSMTTFSVCRRIPVLFTDANNLRFYYVHANQHSRTQKLGDLQGQCTQGSYKLNSNFSCYTSTAR